MRQRLLEDYLADLDSGHPETLEASRDWHDNEGTPWRVEAAMALGILILFGGLLVLIPLFLWFKRLAE